MKIGENSLPPSTLERFKSNNENSLQKIASGLEINQAADDAAGLQLSNQLSSLIGGQNVAVRNANDAISYAQVAEGALAQADESLLRAESLALQAANGIYSNEQRAQIEQELGQITDQVNDLFSQTSFAGNPVFGNSTNFQLSADAFSAADLSTQRIEISGLSVNDKTSAQNTLIAAQDFRSQISEQRAQIGAFQNGVASNINSLTNANENAADARAQIRDADIASVSAEKVAEQIRLQGSLSLISQANLAAPNVLSLLK